MGQQSKEHLPRPAAEIEEALSPVEPALGYHPGHEFLRVRNTEVRVKGRCRLKDRAHPQSGLPCLSYFSDLGAKRCPGRIMPISALCGRARAQENYVGQKVLAVLQL